MFAYAFYQDNEIAAIRINELVIRLSKQYDCYVFVSNRTQKKEIPNVHFLYVDDLPFSSINKKSNLKGLGKKRKSILRENLYQFKNFKRSFEYVNKCYSRHGKILSNKFDFLFFSYNPLSNILCALKYKKNNKALN